MNTEELYFVLQGPGKKKKTYVAQKQKSEPAQKQNIAENELHSDSGPIIACKQKPKMAHKQNVLENILDNELSLDSALSDNAKQTSDLVDQYSLPGGWQFRTQSKQQHPTTPSKWKASAMPNRVMNKHNWLPNQKSLLTISGTKMTARELKNIGIQ
jgi:hypothetical protein